MLGRHSPVRLRPPGELLSGSPRSRLLLALALPLCHSLPPSRCAPGGGSCSGFLSNPVSRVPPRPRSLLAGHSRRLVPWALPRCKMLLSLAGAGGLLLCADDSSLALFPSRA
jgi:hypothetical protein